MYWIAGLLIAMAVFIHGSIVWAEEKAKGPTCQEQLNDTSVLAHNLGNDRSQKEKQLASAQVTIMQLRQQNEQLTKHVQEMQKALAPKEKADEK